MAYHSRSNSLPSRQHPINSQIDKNLSRLRATEAASTSSSSSVGHKLNGLQDLRRGAEMGLVNEVRKYLICRKAMKKAIRKALKNLKQMETKFNTCSFNKDGENGTVISILREVEAVTISVLESLLSFISGPEAESKLSRWSLVSKFMHQKSNV
ncbi:hypothetical protein DITRI_Ditri08aG0147500 [Diplodiscus trichospermus]